MHEEGSHVREKKERLTLNGEWRQRRTKREACLTKGTNGKKENRLKRRARRRVARRDKRPSGPEAMPGARGPNLNEKFAPSNAPLKAPLKTSLTLIQHFSNRFW